MTSGPNNVKMCAEEIMEIYQNLSIEKPSEKMNNPDIPVCTARADPTKPPTKATSIPIRVSIPHGPPLGSKCVNAAEHVCNRDIRAFHIREDHEGLRVSRSVRHWRKPIPSSGLERRGERPREGEINHERVQRGVRRRYALPPLCLGMGMKVVIMVLRLRTRRKDWARRHGHPWRPRTDIPCSIPHLVVSWLKRGVEGDLGNSRCSRVGVE